MRRILHLSDTHFGTEVPEVVEALKQLAITLQPDIVILSGDITQRAKPLQFRLARDFMDSLPATHKIVIPGNHDIPLYHLPLRLLHPYKHYKQAFQDRESIWQDEEIAIIALDATSRWRHTRGNLSIQHIESNLSTLALEGQILIMVAHQPLAVKWPEDSHNILIDAQAIAAYFSRSKVDMVLSGHVHVPLSDTTANAFPELARHYVLAGAGTATSHRTRRNLSNSVYLIIGEPKAANQKEIQIVSYIYQNDNQNFVEKDRDLFLFQQDNWIKQS